MRILAVGGGSGGHVTPVVAVLRDIKHQRPRAIIRFWCDKKFAPQAQGIVSHFDPNLRVETIFAGKFRRYYHLTKLQHITVPNVFWPNLKDAFLVLFGTVQSIFKLLRFRPDVIFIKGGYVSLPVGWAARLLHIPYVIHDSDAHPGLTSRLLAKGARSIATGVPLEYYSYPPEKSHYVGVPISDEFRPYTTAEAKAAKERLGFSTDRPLVIVIGGGLGAKRLNDAVETHLEQLLKLTNVYLVSGTDQYDELRALTPQNDERFQLTAFVSHGMPDIFGAADIVVSRAGATFLLELAASAKTTIVVPSKRLIWQVKHAEMFRDKGAVYYLDEDTFEAPGSTSLVDAVKELLGDDNRREQMAKALQWFTKPHAAHDMANLILGAAKKK